MEKKLDEITEHAELIQKLTTLIPNTGIHKRRLTSIINEAEMIKQLAQSLKEDSVED